MRKLIWFLGFVMLLTGIWLASYSSKIFQINSNSRTSTNSPIALTEARVVKVFDGDSIEIDTGQKVRYIGIDAAEVYPKILCYSEEAKKENERLVFGKEVKLVKDVSETDKYGRLLRYVYVNDIFVNKELVKNGYAKVMTVFPDTKFESEFVTFEKFAKVNLLGLWGKCRE